MFRIGDTSRSSSFPTSSSGKPARYSRSGPFLLSASSSSPSLPSCAQHHQDTPSLCRGMPVSSICTRGSHYHYSQALRKNAPELFRMSENSFIFPINSATPMDESMRSLFPVDELQAYLCCDPSPTSVKPTIRGTGQRPDIYFQNSVASLKYEATSKTVEDCMKHGSELNSTVRMSSPSTFYHSIS